MLFDSIPKISTPSSEKLIERKVASIIASANPSAYDFSDEVMEYASRYMGWTSLCSNPPFSIEEIAEFADEVRSEGLTDVVLIGQGGSTQAPMSVSSVLKANGLDDVAFHTLDSLSPRVIKKLLLGIDPQTSLFIISSKSGTTLESLSVARCIWSHVRSAIGSKLAAERFVVITDPGSKLETIAKQKCFRKVFNGSPNVGGRFSALSVFGLLPFALMGIDIKKLIEDLVSVEQQCSLDSLENPAIRLASFINECRLRERDKIVFNISPSCGCLGLWLEQLVAESLGKNSKGILPCIEPDIDLLSTSANDRCVIVYTMAAENAKNAKNADVDFSNESDGVATAVRADEDIVESASYISASERVAKIHPDTPSLSIEIKSPIAICAHFILWEFTISLIGYLTWTNPFDQPDVEITKQAVRDIVFNKRDPIIQGFDITDSYISFENNVYFGFEISEVFLPGNQKPNDVDDALRLLFSSLRVDNFFSINSFICEEGKRGEILENLRREIAKKTGCVTCLENGPRYLHSVGQFQKGGYNKGVYLIVSAVVDPKHDLRVPFENYSLGFLAGAQAKGDFAALSQKIRRAVHIRLQNDDGQTLKEFAQRVSRHIPSHLLSMSTRVSYRN